MAELHAKSTHPAHKPFPFAWEEIGPGYCYGPALGHWDIAHAILDVMRSEPQHAREQILNDLAAQQEDGFLPGVIYMRDESPTWSTMAIRKKCGANRILNSTLPAVIISDITP